MDTKRALRQIKTISSTDLAVILQELVQAYQQVKALLRHVGQCLACVKDMQPFLIPLLEQNVLPPMAVTSSFLRAVEKMLSTHETAQQSHNAIQHHINLLLDMQFEEPVSNVAAETACDILISEIEPKNFDLMTYSHCIKKPGTSG